VLHAGAYVFATPECFGGMSGLLKDFFERIYYPTGDRLAGRGYASVIVAGQDGQGAKLGIDRIARGLQLRMVQPGLIVPSQEVETARANCEELGATFAHGLACGLF
jgi:multimeric flavodoxin WrbA